MGYLLLWAEGMAIAQLCLALATRWAVVRGSIFRAAAPIMVWLLFAAMAGFMAFAFAPWQREYGPFLPADVFLSSLSWLVVFLLGAVLLLRRAYHRPAPGMARAGADWSRKHLGLSLAGAILAFGITFWNLDLAIRADLALARLEAGDLLQTVTPPSTADADNPARLYIEAGKGLTTPLGDPWRVVAVRGVSADPRGEVNWKDPAVVELVARQENALTLLRKAAALPPGTLDRRRSLNEFGVDGDVEWLRSEEMTFLAVDARVKAAQGNLRRALEDVAAMLGMSRHVPTFLSGPALIGSPVRAWRTLEDVLRLAADTKDTLPVMAFPEVIPPFRVVHQERAVMAMIWPVMLQDPLRVRQIRENAGQWFEPPTLYVMESLVIPACRVVLMPAELRASRKAWDEYRHVLDARNAGTPQDWADLRTTIEAGPRGILSALYMRPKERKLLRDAGEAAVLGEMARAALAATHYREKHKQYPVLLEQLVPAFLPAVPADPRDGEAIRIKHFAGVSVLYTAQNNQSLEAAKNWDAEKYKDDPVFRLYPRRPSR